MLCPKCGKESNNQRVCAFCQTPYPKAASESARAARNSGITLSPAMTRGILIGVVAVVGLIFYMTTREKSIPVGKVLPNLIAVPMSAAEAASLVASIGASAQVEARGDALTLKVPAAMFPQRREGQLAFAQQYARADEIVSGKKRTITFVDPDGSPFAKAEPGVGVMMTR
jgi:hypothetical protein